MSLFITRIELHTDEANDYAILHDAMEQEGFSRTIRDDETSILYHLPSAEYFIKGEFTNSIVMEAAKRAAGKTGKSFMILVSDAALINWVNLPPVK